MIFIYINIHDLWRFLGPGGFSSMILCNILLGFVSSECCFEWRRGISKVTLFTTVLFGGAQK